MGREASKHPHREQLLQMILSVPYSRITLPKKDAGLSAPDQYTSGERGMFIPEQSPFEIRA